MNCTTFDWIFLGMAAAIFASVFGSLILFIIALRNRQLLLAKREAKQERVLLNQDRERFNAERAEWNRQRYDGWPEL